MMEYERRLLIMVLVFHRPTQTSACACGKVPLGASWPEHIADIYEMTKDHE